jgi:DNA-binding SARP family transcriptional activator
MNAPWRIEMLGWLRTVQGEQHVTRFRRQKTGALLAYLAYRRQRSHPREALIELLWPECDPSAGRNRLSVALSSLRRQLEPPGVPAGAVIIADHSTVRLNPDAVTTDVDAFEARLRAARMAPGARRLRQLSEAGRLYSGELLPGYFDSWILPERQRLAEAFSDGIGMLIGLLEETGEYPQALPWARRLIAVDPLEDSSHQILIRLLTSQSSRIASAGARPAAWRAGQRPASSEVTATSANAWRNIPGSSTMRMLQPKN